MITYKTEKKPCLDLQGTRSWYFEHMHSSYTSREAHHSHHTNDDPLGMWGVVW